MLDELGMLCRYGLALREFMRKPLSENDRVELVREHRDNCCTAFLGILRSGIYLNPCSLYRRVLEHAGLGFDQVSALVESERLEHALLRLHDCFAGPRAWR